MSGALFLPRLLCSMAWGFVVGLAKIALLFGLCMIWALYHLFTGFRHLEAS